MLPNTPCIYKIVNLINGKVYVGSAARLANRWNKHQYDFRKNKNSRYLQRAWNKYGKENFKLKILKRITRRSQETKAEFYDRLWGWEQLFIEFYESYKKNKGYNLARKAGAPLSTGFTGKHSEKTKKLLSKKANKRWKNKQFRKEVTKINKDRYTKDSELKNRIAITNGSRPFNVRFFDGTYIGKFINKNETCNLLSINRQTIVDCLEGRRKHIRGFIFKYAKNDKKLGLKVPLNVVESKRLIQGEKPIKAFRYETGEFIALFNSLKEAVKKLKVHSPHISQVLSGDRKEIKGYTFEYAL